MKASFLAVQVKCVPKKDSLHLLPRCRKRKHSLLLAQALASRGQPNKPWSEVLLMATFMLWRVRNTRAKWKPSDPGEKMIQTVQLGHLAGSLWCLTIWSLCLLKFYLKRWQMMTEHFPARLVTCLRHITWLASLRLGVYFSFPVAMIAIIPWRNQLKGKGLYSAHSLQSTTAGRSNKQELGAHYIYSQEKGAVKANLELSAPSLLVQTKIPVKKQCYPQWPHCPTLLNNIKISLNKACPESHLSGDLRFCQTGDRH